MQFPYVIPVEEREVGQKRPWFLRWLVVEFPPRRAHLHLITEYHYVIAACRKQMPSYEMVLKYAAIQKLQQRILN